MRRMWMPQAVLASVVLQAGGGFDPVKDVTVSVSGGGLSVVIPKGVHLKVRWFRVILTSPGALHVGVLPPPTGEDEAGNPIWRGTVRVDLTATGLEDPARLVLTYQPCTEGPDRVCFLPVKRTLTVLAKDIPA